ncbi:hypothetical protein FYZ48_29065 [Gimesia chilikensis]|uniref:hypothetical protein n=1 Tax=Gimesia chilikensis TaxID=2605989 RepID=UPI0011EFF532|nr:hypothetical protein [Gimesia chilikensis]KAA0132159.1 hypothetical protein FYZ48_29065 [Gimesia chilikensis]
MKRWSVPLLVVLVIVSLVSNSLWSAPEAESDQDKVSALLKRIEQLEQRVEQLEKTHPLTIVPTHPQVQLKDLQPNVPPASTIHRRWKEQQINGMKYYIVPLQSSQVESDIKSVAPSLPLQADPTPRSPGTD